MVSLLHGRLRARDQRAWLAKNNKPVIIDEAPPFDPAPAGASWTARPKPGILAALQTYPDRAAVAQWIEYWPPKPRVAGSIPASRASVFLLPASPMLSYLQNKIAKLVDSIKFSVLLIKGFA